MIDLIKKNIEITDSKLGKADVEINSDAHMKRIRNGFNFFYPHMKDDNKDAKILDIGCRNGNLLKIFQDEGYINLYGIDVSQKALDLVPEGINTLLADIQNIPFENEFFDVVTATHVLEHCENPNDAVSEMIRVLKKGGLLFVEVPLENRKRPEAGHFCHFTETSNVFKMFKTLFIIDFTEDYKLRKDSVVGVKKRRWFRIVMRKI
jgi:ubiquinone/menaquinone biosynthesis C-methylase UbiE